MGEGIITAFPFKLYMKDKLISLANLSRAMGLDEKDYNAVISLITAGEYRIAVEWLIDQLYEYDIKIDLSHFLQIETVAKSLKVEFSRINDLKELIK